MVKLAKTDKTFTALFGKINVKSFTGELL